MKMALLLLTLASCTTKFVEYDLIRKVDFNHKTYDRPITLTEVLPSGRDTLKSCFNQWLFFSNAEKEKEEAIPLVVRSLCPGRDFLVKSEMSETWWTTIVFTRSCVEMKTLCGDAKKKK